MPLLKRIMSSEDIAEAMAYSRIDPMESYKQDYRHAVLCWLIAAVNGNKKSKVVDFIPRYGENKIRNKLVDDIKEAFKIGDTG